MSMCPECEKSHASYESVMDSFLKASKLLTEACMKNKSLWEQACLWKEQAQENTRLRAEVETANGAMKNILISMENVNKDRDAWKAKAKHYENALRDIAVLDNDAYYEKGTFEEAIQIAKAALAPEGEKA